MLSIFPRLAEQSLWTALRIVIMVGQKAASTVPLCYMLDGQILGAPSRSASK
jgi:hypothetical protein